MSSWSQREAPLPVAVVLSIFDDLLQDLDGAEVRACTDGAALSLADVYLDEHGVASLRGRDCEVRELSTLLAEVLGATGEASIPLAVRGLLRAAEEAAPPLDAAWFRAELRRTLGPPGSRAELRALMDAVEVRRDFASLIPAEALLDSVRPEDEVAHATFVDPTRPELAMAAEPSVLETRSAPIEPAAAPTTFDLPPAEASVDVAAAPEPAELEPSEEPERAAPAEAQSLAPADAEALASADVEVLAPEPVEDEDAPEFADDEVPTERPSPASARPGAAYWADSISSSVPEPAVPLVPAEDPATELMTASALRSDPEDQAELSESAFLVEAQTAFASEPAPEVGGAKSDDLRPVVRHEPSRLRPVSLTYAPAARLRSSTPAEETPSRIRIPAEERGRAWAILVFSLVIGLAAAWALGYLP